MDIKVSDIGKEIDSIVGECLPAVVGEKQGFLEALKIASGIDKLRIIFDNPEIKKTILAMAGTNLGFKTDRDPAAIESAKRKGKSLRSYSYAEIKETCIEAMLKGFRITGNEFNIIAGGFYPAKNGKYRKIIEHEGITDFDFTCTNPKYESNNTAKIQCFASWRQDGTLRTLGYRNEKHEDTCVIAIKTNAYMGEDAIIGKAQSKLFSRVLQRITGKILPESADTETIIDITPAETTPEKTSKPEPPPDPVNSAKVKTDPPPEDTGPTLEEIKAELAAMDGEILKNAADALGCSKAPLTFDGKQTLLNKCLDLMEA